MHFICFEGLAHSVALIRGFALFSEPIKVADPLYHGNYYFFLFYLFAIINLMINNTFVVGVVLQQ